MNVNPTDKNFNVGLFLLVSLMISCTSNSNHSTIDDSTDEASQLALEIKQEFEHAWSGYQQYAKGSDELRPLSKKAHNWYGHSLLFTPIDAYDTMLLLGLDSLANENKQVILSQLDFNQDIYVQHFEVVVRVLGGLLAAYQWDEDPQFLALAKDVADRMLTVFISPTGLPYREVNLQTGHVRDSLNHVAEMGTLLLEYGLLSKLTNEPMYFEKAKTALLEIYRRRDTKTNLVGQTINVETGEWVGVESHVSTTISSYYEYLLKAAILFEDDELMEMYQTSISAVMTNLWEDTPSGSWLGMSNRMTGVRTQKLFTASSTFLPSILALGGDLGKAESLQESCFKLWTNFEVVPDAVRYDSMQIISPDYDLRANGIESAYYLYQSTQNEKYRNMGAFMFNSIRNYCRVESGYAALKDVRSKERKDLMGSHLFAETFKYAYLLFDDTNPEFLERVVFNTAGHPFLKIN